MITVTNLCVHVSFIFSKLFVTVTNHQHTPSTMSKSMSSIIIVSSAVLTTTTTAATASPAATADKMIKKLHASSQDIRMPASLLPKEWTSLRAKPPADKVTSSFTTPIIHPSISAEPTGYFIANIFSESNDCSTQNTVKAATGTGVCFVGMSNNTAVGSLAYEFEGVSGDYFLINKGVWNTLDCSGTPTVYTLSFPTSCLPSSNTEETSITYTYSVGAIPWTQYAPGFMYQ